MQVPPALPRRHHRPPRNPGALHQVQVLVSFYFEPASNFPPGPLWSPLVRASAFSPQGLIVEREKKTFVSKEFSPGTPCTPCTSSSNCSYATSSPLSLSSSASSDQGATLPNNSKKKRFFRTFAAKRISLIFLGEPAVCECGPSGAELTRPHECPKMARWSNFCNFWVEEILIFLVSRSRPDILRDTESRLGERMLPPASPPSTVEKTKKSLPVLLEDPVSCPASR